MINKHLSRRGSASSSFGPLTSLKAGYGQNAEKLGKAANKLKEITKEKKKLTKKAINNDE